MKHGLEERKEKGKTDGRRITTCLKGGYWGKNGYVMPCILFEAKVGEGN